MNRGTLLVDTHPDIAAEWHPTRNAGMDLSSIGTFSNKKVWWVHYDQKGDLHQWAQIVRNRTYAGSGCGACQRFTGRTQRGFQAPAPGRSVAETHPEVAGLWNHERNVLPDGTRLTASMVSGGQLRRVWWRCEAGHEWIEKVALVAQGEKGCPECVRVARTPRLRSGVSLAQADPALAAQWHPTRNGDLTPSAVSPQTNRKVWWLGDCGHSWSAYIHIRTSQGTGCPRCNTSGGSRKQAWAFRRGEDDGTHSLAVRNPAIAAEWHPTKNGDLTPADVSYGAENLVWWRCAQGHEWQQGINRRTHRGQRCWACTHPLRLPANEKAPEPGCSVADLHPVTAALWHPHRNGHLTPADVRPTSKANVWWQCPEGHHWRAQVSSRVNGEKHGTGCRACANTAERSRRGLGTEDRPLAA